MAPVEEEPPKVVNLMEALRQSLERVSTTKKKTAKIENGKTVRIAAAGGRKSAPPGVTAEPRPH